MLGRWRRQLVQDLGEAFPGKGDCWDNAPMESFFHTLKTELVHHRDYPNQRGSQDRHFRACRGLLQPQPEALQPWASSPQSNMKSSKWQLNHVSTESGEDQPMGRRLDGATELDLSGNKKAVDKLDAPPAPIRTLYAPK